MGRSKKFNYEKLLKFKFFFDGSPWYQMQPKKIWKIFWPQKRGFSTGLNTQKKNFFEFFS
jgi:hypothetical protein